MSSSAEQPSPGALTPPSESDSLESTAQENELFRAAFERSALGMVHLSTEGIFLRVNTAFCEMTGYGSVELTGMHFKQIMLASDYGVADEERRLRITTVGGSYTAERRFFRKDGEIIWVQLTATMLTDAAGKAKYGMSVIEDITLRKSAELRLQRLNRLHCVVGKISEGAAQAQDRYALHALACRIAVQRGGLRLALVADIDHASGALHSVAAREGDGGARLGGDLDAAIASTGTFADAVRAGRWSLCATATAPSEWQRLAGANGIGSTACFPLRAGGMPTGALIVAAAEADYFQADEIDLLMAAANCLSLTAESQQAERQRRHAEDEMRRQKSLLSSASHIAGIGSWDLDVATGRLVGSDETMRMLGLDRATFGGTTSAFLKLVHPDDKEMLRERFVGMNASTDVVELEYRIVRPDGAERVILDRAATIETDGEQSLRRAGMVMDITERRQADVQQRRHAERLTALVEAQRVLAHSDATVEHLFDRIPDLALGIVQADGATFELVDGDSMICRAMTAAGAGQIGFRFAMAGSLSGEAIRLDRSIRCDDAETDPRAALTICRQLGVRSVLATVVRDRNGPIGVLKLFGRAVAQFVAAESDSLELLAEALGAAIQRKRADEEIQRSLHIQRGIAGIQQEMVSSGGDLQAMLDLMTERALELTGATGSAILTIDGDDVVYRSTSGSATGQRELRLPRAKGLVGMSMNSDTTLRCDDAGADPRVNAAAAREFGMLSMITTPLRAGGAVIGALIVFSGRASAFALREESTLQILAQWMSSVMQRSDAERLLRASEAEYRIVFTANPLPMWVLDAERHHFLAVNDAALAKYGYSHAEFMALTIRDLRPASGLPLLQSYLARIGDKPLLASGWQHCTRDGTIIDVEVSSNSIVFGNRPAHLVLAHDVTERKRAERKVQKSEAVLAIAGRVAHVAGWSFDFSQRSFEHSEDLCAVLDLPSGSVVSNKQALAFYTRQSRATMFAAVNACARDGTPYDLELELITAKGRRIGVRTIGQAVRDAAGAIVGAQGAVQDISESKHAAEEMQALAKRLNDTLQSITHGFFTLDRDLRVTYVNAKTERMLRRPASEILGQRLADVLPVGDNNEFYRRYCKVLETQRPENFESFSSQFKVWFEIDAYPSESGLTVYYRDVTDRHRGEEQVRLLETCVAHMNDVVVISEVSQDGDTVRIAFVNDAFVRCTGYSREEAIGKTPSLLHGLLTSTAELAKIRASLLEGQPARAELLNYRKDGSTYWVELEVVPIRSPAGEVSHWIGVQRDTTERRQGEEALRLVNETLESRVSERTVALEQARHEAEEASRAKSSFVATMSHEIRTPINGVIGMIDVLEQTDLDHEQSKMLDLARDSAYSLMGIIEDILDFSKIEAGKVELEREPMSVSDIVQKVCALVGGVAGASGVRVAVTVDPMLSQPVWGDAVRVRQILVNLVNNAIKFSGHSCGGGLVSVSASRRLVAPGKVGIELIVEDNGIGMDRATLDRLFSPFSQADVSTTRRFGGTGLGLTICKLLVELMGGEILVKSTPDVGSTFTIRLPVDIVATQEKEPFDVTRSRSGGTARRIGGASHPELILVAEDNAINQKVIAAQLKLLGYRSEIADNGSDALVLWRNGRFAMLLTDLQMPEMDGYDLATRIRSEEPGGPRLPIIALTANALKEEAKRCAAAGMDDYLTKPVQLTRLEALLDLHFGSARLPDRTFPDDVHAALV